MLGTDAIVLPDGDCRTLLTLHNSKPYWSVRNLIFAFFYDAALEPWLP